MITIKLDFENEGCNNSFIVEGFCTINVSNGAQIQINFSAIYAYK